jgi:hypothetical protein
MSSSAPRTGPVEFVDEPLGTLEEGLGALHLSHPSSQEGGQVAAGADEAYAMEARL